MDIRDFQPDDIYQVRELINAHLDAVVPGWALPDDYILARLESDPGEYVVDPWVSERVTLCAVEAARIVAVAHLLRYGDAAPVGDHFRGAAEIGWFVCWPDAAEASPALLMAAVAQMDLWQSRPRYAAISLPVPIFSGVPDSWPHIEGALRAAGFETEDDHREAVFGGWLNKVDPPGEPPMPGLSLRRRLDRWGACFLALLDGREIGWCECVCNLTRGGALRAFTGWGEIAEMQVNEEWRNRGIGTWLVRHAMEWVRLAGCDRVVFAVAAEDEAAGAGRYYRRFGWDCFTRLRKGWRLP